MTVLTARGWLENFGRNAKDSSMYSDTMKDQAVQMVLNRFIRMVRPNPTQSLIDLIADDPTVDLSAVEFDDFAPDLVNFVYVEGVAAPLKVVSYPELWRLKTDTPATADATHIAFSEWSEAEVYPTPPTDLTLYLHWVTPLVTWTPGDAGGTVINLPDRWLAEILPYGPPAVLQSNEPEHLFANESWKKYLEIEKSLASAGSLGAKSLQRQIN